MSILGHLLHRFYNVPVSPQHPQQGSSCFSKGMWRLMMFINLREIQPGGNNKTGSSPAGRGMADSPASLFPHATQPPQLSSYFYGNYNVRRGGDSSEGKEEGGYRSTGPLVAAGCRLQLMGFYNEPKRVMPVSRVHPPLPPSQGHPGSLSNPGPHPVPVLPRGCSPSSWFPSPHWLLTLPQGHKYLWSLPCPMCRQQEFPPLCPPGSLLSPSSPQQR